MSDKISYVAKSIGIIGALVIFACSTSNRQPASGPIPQTLVLGIDGISYATFKKMQDGGHFRNFTSVAPMYATFPSISDPNWTKIFDLDPEPGFTKAFFDPTIKTKTGIGKENGSITSHFSRMPRYEKVSDFKLDGIWEHLTTFVWTETTAYYWLDSLEKKFLAFKGRDSYFALIINSDLLSHTEGEKNVMKYLSKIDEKIEKIQERYKDLYGTELEVVMVSDHGNEFVHGLDVPYESSLTKAGWKIASTITGTRDVAFYVPEMVSFGAFYCDPQSASELAHAMAKVPHVQTSSYAVSPNDIRVIGNDGSEAQIIVDNSKQTVHYKILKGADPLNQAQHFTKGPIKFDAYFMKSNGDTYPYSAVRIWEGFNNNSVTKAQVLVDPKPGYVFGNKALRLLTDIKGFSSTHGSLHRTQTMGIFASTKRQFPAIRPEDFKKFVNVSGLR